MNFLGYNLAMNIIDGRKLRGEILFKIKKEVAILPFKPVFCDVDISTMNVRREENITNFTFQCDYDRNNGVVAELCFNTAICFGGASNNEKD